MTLLDYLLSAGWESDTNNYNFSTLGKMYAVLNYGNRKIFYGIMIKSIGWDFGARVEVGQPFMTREMASTRVALHIPPAVIHQVLTSDDQYFFLNDNKIQLKSKATLQPQ
jgi:hypothetical protein